MEKSISAKLRQNPPGDSAVDRRVYTDPEIFREEMHRVFGQAWIYVAHQSQLREPGSYVLAEIGGHGLIVMRDDGGTIGAFYNRCPHRGTRLLDGAAGQVKLLSCSYHGWTFRRDGSLASVPLKEDYGPNAVCAGLESVACVQSYRGFVFARRSAQGPALEEWLGPAARNLDNMIERAPDGEIEIAFGSLRMMQRSNWKIYLENSHDGVHALPTHVSSFRPAQRVMEKAGDPWSRFQAQVVAGNSQSLHAMEQLLVNCHPNGHTDMVGFRKARSQEPEYLAYEAALSRRVGREGVERILGEDRHNAVIYPSLSIQPAYLQLRVVVPVTVDQTRIDVWLFRLKGASSWMDRRVVAYANTIHSPASLVRADDLENYERIQRGLLSGDAPAIDCSRRLSDDQDVTKRSTATSERFIRHQHAAWRSYMRGDVA